MSWFFFFFFAPRGGQNMIWMTSGCLCSRKVWWVVRIGGLCQKLRYFTDQNGLKRGPHENKFWIFSNKKMNAEIRWKKWGPSSSFLCFLLELWSLNCPRKYIFCNSVLTSVRNLSLLKKLAYMHLKVLIALFKKMIRFIGVWTPIHEILTINIQRKTLTQQKVNETLRLRILKSLKL